jgi:hypothetical protein
VPNERTQIETKGSKHNLEVERYNSVFGRLDAGLYHCVSMKRAGQFDDPHGGSSGGGDEDNDRPEDSTRFRAPPTGIPTGLTPEEQLLWLQRLQQQQHSSAASLVAPFADDRNLDAGYSQRFLQGEEHCTNRGIDSEAASRYLPTHHARASHHHLLNQPEMSHLFQQQQQHQQQPFSQFTQQQQHQNLPQHEQLYGQQPQGSSHAAMMSDLLHQRYLGSGGGGGAVSAFTDAPLTNPHQLQSDGRSNINHPHHLAAQSNPIMDEMRHAYQHDVSRSLPEQFDSSLSYRTQNTPHLANTQTDSFRMAALLDAQQRQQLQQQQQQQQHEWTPNPSMPLPFSNSQPSQQSQSYSWRHHAGTDSMGRDNLLNTTQAILGASSFAPASRSDYWSSSAAGDHRWDQSLAAASAATGVLPMNAAIGSPGRSDKVSLMGHPTNRMDNMTGIAANTAPRSTAAAALFDRSASGFGRSDTRHGLISSPKRLKAKATATVTEGTYNPGPVRDLSLPSDKGNLSEYQCLLREQIVLFAVTDSDIQCSAQGRNRPITLGQVGVLCRHCARIPPGMRPSGAVYFPAKLSGLYQASQNMAINHFNKSCHSISEATRARLFKLKERKSTVLGGGKHFWANGARVIGVIECDQHLRFKDNDAESELKSLKE